MYTEDSDGQVIITLNSGDYQALLVCLGYASGAALNQGEIKLADSFLQLANSVNYGSPDWTPYETASLSRHSGE